MTGFHNEYYQQREAWDSQIQENSARHAWATGKVTSSGWGDFILDEPIMFDTTFVNEPVVSYGWAMNDDDQLDENFIPRCSGGVLRWVLDEHDYWVGAHVLIAVAIVDPIVAAQAWAGAAKPYLNTDGSTYAVAPQVPTDPADFNAVPDYDLTHHFTFTAMAIKGVTLQ